MVECVQFNEQGPVRLQSGVVVLRILRRALRVCSCFGEPLGTPSLLEKTSFEPAIQIYPSAPGCSWAQSVVHLVDFGGNKANKVDDYEKPLRCSCQARGRFWRRSVFAR